MSPALAAAFILFNGHNLDGWKVLSGEWEAKDRAIVCKAPGEIRPSFESDAYRMTFEFRSPGAVFVEGEIPALGSLIVNSGPKSKGHRMTLIRQGLVARVGLVLGHKVAPDEWILAEVQVRPDVIQTSSYRTDGSKIVDATWKNPPGARGFVTFKSNQAGLEIRNVKVTEPNFTSLFDGKTLKGWEPVGKDSQHKPNWTVKDGVLECDHYVGYGNWLRTQESYDNFVIRLEYWLPPKGNSGVYLHAPLEGRISQIGQEIQLLDNAGYPNTKPAQKTGAVYAGIAPEVDVPCPAEEWNAIEIFSQGKRIRTTLNGVQLYDARLDDKSKDAQLLHNPLATRRLTGFIGLQDHTGGPKFRNIRIRTLPAESQPDGNR